jgi:hypothetical protein
MVYTTKIIKNTTLLDLSVLLILSCKKVSLPGVTTAQVTSILQRSVYSGGQVTSDEGALVTARGVCWNTQGAPTISDSHSSDGEGSGLFSSILTDLTLNTTYHIRAYATNSLGTGYGSDVEFTQMEPITDSDGNTYSIVTIGTQVWLGNNLKTSKFNDGTSIPYLSTANDWVLATGPAFCWYKNSEVDNKAAYGGAFVDIGYYGYFWSATSSTTTSNAYSYDMYFDLNLVSKDEFSKKDGGSVRCIKNSQ